MAFDPTSWGAFDDADVAALGLAYDKACQALHDRGQPAIVREVLATRILALAGRGERDPDRLCAAALGALAERTDVPVD